MQETDPARGRRCVTVEQKTEQEKSRSEARLHAATPSLLSSAHHPLPLHVPVLDTWSHASALTHATCPSAHYVDSDTPPTRSGPRHTPPLITATASYILPFGSSCFLPCLPPYLSPSPLSGQQRLPLRRARGRQHGQRHQAQPRPHGVQPAPRPQQRLHLKQSPGTPWHE